MRFVFQISKKIFQKTILSLEFKFPINYSILLLAGNLNFKSMIVFWNISFGDLKNTFILPGWLKILQWRQKRFQPILPSYSHVSRFCTKPFVRYLCGYFCNSVQYKAWLWRNCVFYLLLKYTTISLTIKI